MHIGGFKEFFLFFFFSFFFFLPSFSLFILGACDNLHIVSIYVHTKGSCWQMDGMYLQVCALYLDRKWLNRVINSGFTWTYRL